MRNAAAACVLGLPGWAFVSSRPPDPTDPADMALLLSILNVARDMDEERMQRLANEVAKRFA